MVADETKNNQKNKMGFFKKIYYSIVKFEKYPEMAAEGTFSAIKYLSLLMVIFSVIACIGFEIGLYKTVKKSIDFIDNKLPDLSYKNGTLNVNSTEAIKLDSEIPAINKIIIDTNTDSEQKINEHIDSIPNDNTGIILLKDKIIAKPIGGKECAEYKYEDIISNMNSLNKENITKQDLINYLKGDGKVSIFIMFFVIMIIYLYIVYFISVLVDTLLIAVLGGITALFTKLKIKFSAIYNMSIYSLTLSILLNSIYLTINSITGFKMNYFQIMYTSIAYVYMVAAIFMIRVDFEKKQAELIKIMEEQKKVRQEIKEKDEEDEKQENNDENENTEDKKESKDTKNKQTQEPDGSEA